MERGGDGGSASVNLLKLVVDESPNLSGNRQRPSQSSSRETSYTKLQFLTYLSNRPYDMTEDRRHSMQPYTKYRAYWITPALRNLTYAVSKFTTYLSIRL